MNYIREKNNRKGFTLAEMLIVVAIIAVLVSISVPVFTNKLEKAREAADVANMRSAKSAVLIEYVDGSMDPDDAGDVYYYSASEGTLKTDASDALPVYGQGNASVDGGIRYDDYNETGSSGKVIGTDAKDKIIKITVTPSDDGLENGIHVEMEWVDE